MTKLILVDSRVADIAEIANSMMPNTEMVTFNFLDDTFESLKAKITGQYDSVCIAQHNYEYSTVKFLNCMADATIKNVEVEDPNLLSWSPIIELFSWLKNEAGCQYIDLLACNIWADADWRYAILKLREVAGVYIRASVNITGAGGDFILESDNVDLIGIYFTENINNYKYQFYYQPTGTWAPHNANPMPPALSSGGTVSTTAYVSLIGSMLNCGTGLAGTTYVNPPTDMSNIVNFVSNSYQALPCAYAAITASGKVITFGRNTQGGDSSAYSSALSSGIIKVVATSMAFAALKNDGTVVSWGQVLDNNRAPANITTTTDAAIVPPSAVTLTNCKDIAASSDTFAALKNDGTVVTWGTSKKWASTTSALVGVTKIKETYGYPNYSYIALRSDGHAVMWGVGGVATTTALTSTSPIIDIYATDYACVIIRADRTVYKNFTNTVTYTIPAGKNVVDVYAIYNSYDFAILLDDRTLYASDVNTSYSNVSYFVSSDSAYAFISNGAVITRGDSRSGGSTTDTTNGIKSGISVTSGVIKLACSSGSMAALKSDGTVAVWGANGGGWPYVSAVQSQLTNVVHLFDFGRGYIAITSDGKLVSWGDNYNSWYGTPTSSFSNTLTLTSGKTVAMFSAVATPFIVDYTITNTVSPSTVTQYASNTITYSTNVAYAYAMPGRKYGLYYGSTRIATYYPVATSFTYVFENAQFSTSGTLSCSIIDYTDVSYTMGTCTIIVNSAAQIAPSPAVVKSLVNENNTLTALVSAGANVQNVQLSIDGGATYQTYTSSIVSSASINIPGFNVATGTSAMSTLSYTTASGGKIYAIDSARNKIMAINCALPSSAVTLVDVGNAPASAKSLAFSTDGSKGIICNSTYCYSINGSFSVKQINDSISRQYKAVDINSSGTRIVALADNLYYGIWVDSIQTYSQLTLANGDIGGGSCLALSPDGFIVAYTTSDGSIKYAFWTGSKYTDGTEISGTPSSPVSMRFMQNGNVLICSALVGTTPDLFYSYWNGSIFTPWTNLNVTFGIANASPVGLCVDSNNQIYASCTGSSAITRWLINLKYKSITNNNIIKLTSGISSASSYNVLAQSVSSAGTSVAGGVTDFSSDGNSLTIKFTVPVTSDTILKYSYSEDNITFYDISASAMTTGTVIISSGFPLDGLSILTLFLRVHYQTSGIKYIGSLTKSTPVIINPAPQVMAVITDITPDDSALQIHFTNALPNGQTVIKYQYSINGNAFFDLSPSSVINGTYTIEGLTNGTEYSIQMRTITNLLTSSLSNEVTGIPATIAPPTPPTISVTSVSSNQATITYNPGTGNDVLYSEYSTDNGLTYIPFSNLVTTTKIYGLVNGVPTNVLFRTVTANGTSSPNTYTITSKDIPSRPIITEVTASNESCTIYLTNGDLNGGTLTGYSVSINGGAFNTVSQNDITTVDSDAEIIVRGLTNGTKYRVTIKAITEVGSSLASNTYKNILPYSAPETPIINNVVAINGGIKLYFSLPSNNTGGLPIIGYKYILNDGLQENWIYSSPSTITDLSNGINYSIKIQAVNTELSSEYTASYPSIMPFNVPAAPFISKILPGDGKVYVYFNELQLNGSSLVKLRYNLGSAWIDASGTSSPLTIYGLTNKTFYNICITACNTAGESYPSNIVNVLAGAPQPPEITNVTFGDKQLTVTFNMPMNNGLIKTIMGGVSTNPSVVPTLAKLTGAPLLTDTSYTVVIPKLTNGTPYYVRLQLANAVGSSAYSAVYGPTIPAGIPPALSITNVIANSIDSALVYIAPTTNNGDAISKVMYSIGTNPTKYDFTGLSSPFTISGLSVNTPYTFMVYSQNKAGISLPSKPSPSKPFIIQYVIPTAPAKITTTAYRDPSSTYLSPTFFMNVSFAPPSVNPLTPITTYKYIVSTTSGSTDIIDASTTKLPLKIQINPNIAYSVKVIATNMVGDSAQSTITAPVTALFLPPFPPTIKSITQIGSGSVEIGFTPSTLREVPVTKYVYTLDEGVTYVDMTINASGNLVATDLSNNVPISTFKIVAQSPIGNSTLSSAAKSFTILYSVPAAPVLAAPTISGSSATISFPTPLANGSPITGYVATITYINAAKIVTTTTQDFSSSPLSLTGLSAGGYSVTVKAVNALGQSAASAANKFAIA